MTVSGSSLTAPTSALALRPIKVPSWVRVLFAGVSTLSPPVARRLARRLFFTPLPARQRSEDVARLANGERFRLEGRFGSLAGWSWGSGPPVLLVHGWGGYAGQMTSVVAPLCTAGHRVLALDMPAHGHSQGKVTSLVHFEDAISRVAAYAGSLHGIVAHSFGAAAATYALSRGLPVTRAVYLSPPADFASFYGRFRTALGVRDRIWEGMLRDAETWLGVSFAKLEPTTLAPALRQPLLVVHDRSDREVLFEEGTRLARTWPGATLHATEGLGHLRILGDPDVTALVVSFLRHA